MHCDRSGGIDTRVDRNPGQRPEGDRRRCRGPPCASVTLAPSGLQPLLGLLLVGDADRALGQRLREGRPASRSWKVTLSCGDRDQPLLEQIVDVGPGDIQRDEFGTLLDARRGRIGASGLAPDFRLAAAAVEES